MVMYPGLLSTKGNRWPAAKTISYGAIFDTSKYVSRTVSSASNRKKWTYSTWFKRASNKGAVQSLFAAEVDANNYTAIGIQSGNEFMFFSNVGGTTVANVLTSGDYLDPGGFYHLVVALDAANTTVTIWVNGVQVPVTINTAVSNIDHIINNNCSHRAGYIASLGGVYAKGVQSETHFVDGLALSANEFGQFNEAGVWVPREYTGSHGTNGFHMDYANSSALGNDVSGNGNHYTATGMATTDQVLDTPSTNIASQNESVTAIGANNITITDGGWTTSYAGGSSGFNGTRTQLYQMPNTGKFYIECKINSFSGSYPSIVWALDGAGHNIGLAVYHTTNIMYYRNHAGDNSLGAGTAPAANDVLGIAFDFDNQYFWIHKNGTYFNSGNPSTGANPFTWTPANTPGYGFINLSADLATAFNYTVNYGQRAFAYSVPTGFNSMVAMSTVGNMDRTSNTNIFAVKKYSGNGSSQDINVGFKPDLVLVKSLNEGSVNYTGWPTLWDSVRGATNRLITSSNGAEAVAAQGLTSFNGYGFSVGSGNALNYSGDDFLALCFKKGAAKGIDIVEYTGDNTANRNISHSLGAVPEFVIVKRTDSTGDWYVYHKSLTSAQHFLKLNSNAAESNTNTPWGTSNWSSTQFMVTNDATNNLNASGATYIAYLFNTESGFSWFSSYTGTGTALKNTWSFMVKPQVLLIKARTGTGDWVLYDVERDVDNPMSKIIALNSDGAEGTIDGINPIINGINVTGTDANINASSVNYIYAMFGQPLGGANVYPAPAR